MNVSLYHTQQKGAKWGVRRWQLPDGTWTPEGLARRRKYENFKAKSHAQVDNFYDKSNNRHKGDSQRIAYNNALRQLEHKKIEDITFDRFDEYHYVIDKAIEAHGDEVVTVMANYLKRNKKGLTYKPNNYEKQRIHRMIYSKEK